MFVFEIIGLIIAAAGIIISAIFWAFLNTCSSIIPVSVGSDLVVPDVCACGVVGDLTNCESHYVVCF